MGRMPTTLHPKVLKNEALHDVEPQVRAGFVLGQTSAIGRKVVVTTLTSIRIRLPPMKELH